jgi:hypothetical protein
MTGNDSRIVRQDLMKESRGDEMMETRAKRVGCEFLQKVHQTQKNDQDTLTAHHNI